MKWKQEKYQKKKYQNIVFFDTAVFESLVHYIWIKVILYNKTLGTFFNDVNRANDIKTVYKTILYLYDKMSIIVMHNLFPWNFFAVRISD